MSEIGSVTVDLTRKHGLPPIIDTASRVLILGTLPGDASLAAQQYYGHPRNHFWPIVGSVLGEDLPTAYADRCTMLLRHRIAVWDVLRSAVRDGSLDQDIKNAEANDFRSLFESYPKIQTLIFNGQKASALYRRHGMTSQQLSASTHKTIIVPSTSPANVKAMEQKAAHWRAALLAAFAL